MTRKKNLRGQISKDKGLISTVNETPDKIRPANEKQQLTQHPQDPPNPSQQPLQILPHLHLPHQIPKIPIPLIRPLPKSPLILPQPLPIPTSLPNPRQQNIFTTTTTIAEKKLSLQSVSQIIIYSPAATRTPPRNPRRWCPARKSLSIPPDSDPDVRSSWWCQGCASRLLSAARTGC